MSDLKNWLFSLINDWIASVIWISPPLPGFCLDNLLYIFFGKIYLPITALLEGALEIDGATDIGADLTSSDLIIVDDGANGTERKAALSRLITLVDANAGFATKGFATAMAIAL